MAVIVSYFTEFGSFRGHYVTMVDVKCRPRNLVFGNMAIFAYIIEKGCVKYTHPFSRAKIRPTLHCASTSAIAELMLHDIILSHLLTELQR